MKYITDLLYLLALIAISPKVVYRMVRHQRYRDGWSQRLGKITRRYPDKKCVWIHAVSVGEVNATRTIVEALNAKLPDCEIVISSTTDTGFARAAALYGDDLCVFYFPFDVSWIMRRAFNRLTPDVCLLMELEVWPNMATIAGDKNIPVAVVNGRLSEKSFPRYKMIKPLTKWMFGKIDLFLVQSEEYAQRFKALGCSDEKVIISGSVKYDTAQIADEVDGSEELSAQLNIGGEQLLVAGATGPGEEKIILEVFKKLKQSFTDLRVAIIPRKPERFNEVAGLIAGQGFSSCRYSQIKSGPAVSDKPDVILGDTMGDLRKFYSLANVVFVGRTLVPMGGSDMIEPAALGKATVFGMHTFNFKQTVEVLLADSGAIEVKDVRGLTIAIERCLADEEFAQHLGANGQRIIRQNQGATDRTVDQVLKLLNL